MPKGKRFAITAALLAMAVLSIPCRAGAAPFDQYIGFGDSTLDSGYFRYNTTGSWVLNLLIVQAVGSGDTGAYVANGVMNSTTLASKFGLTAVPVHSGGGTNYANGGAYTTSLGGTYTIVPTNVPTVAQIQNYLTSVKNHANPNALYVIKTGDNDLNFPNPQPNYLINSDSELAAEVAALQAAGARTIMVPNSYNSAVYASANGNILPADSGAYALSTAYQSQKWADLQADHVNFIPADIDSVFKYVVHNPTFFGFTTLSIQSSNAPALANPPPNNSALLAFPLSPAQQSGGLFVDAVHLTTAGQTIEADYEYSLLTAPSEMSLLAQSAVQGGWARAATIQGQLDPCGQHRGPCGANVWASGGAYSVKVSNAPGFASDSGIPFGGTVGMDYQMQDGLVVGVAFSSGAQSEAFSTGGNFNAVDEAPSLYVAYLDEPWWGNAVVTCDLFQDNTTRFVPLGIFTDQNNGSTTGQSLALALRGGHDFSLGPITTGPVAGLILQQVQVNGFTESGLTGVTALSFGTQTRESLVTQLGWRVCVGFGPLRPFAEMDWNHECGGKCPTVTTSLTSVGAPSWFADAVPVVSDWATSSLGAYYELTPQVMLRGAASAMFINPQMTTVGGDVSLNVCF